MELMTMQVRMTKTEREIFRKAASLKGLTTSAWLRLVLREKSEEEFAKVGKKAEFNPREVSEQVA